MLLAIRDAILRTHGLLVLLPSNGIAFVLLPTNLIRNELIGMKNDTLTGYTNTNLRCIGTNAKNTLPFIKSLL